MLSTSKLEGHISPKCGKGQAQISAPLLPAKSGGHTNLLPRRDTSVVSPASFPQLPIDSLLPEIVSSLCRRPNLIVEAPPGAGKTTRVPPAILESGLSEGGEVWVLEPRRLAANLAARRVAEEYGEPVGETVGFQVRFETVASPKTRLLFLTEGVLARRMLSDPNLRAVSVVILDEFHERHLQTDFALAWLRWLQRSRRPDLHIVVMSATLEADPLSSYLDTCPVLRAEGRRFEVAIEHARTHDLRPLEVQVESAVRRFLAQQLEGDLLVFLPGMAEIRRAQEACATLAAHYDCLRFPLHGALPSTEQDLAVRPAPKRKIILSTNVAESSVTIDGVTAVIDSGLARTAGHSPWSGLATLTVSRISQASAIQRAGRAGRTRPGQCLRLYTLSDFAARPVHEIAEIQRLDLAETVLALHAAGIDDLSRFEWFESPPVASLDAADTLLKRLGALDANGRVTAVGQLMLRFPLHPRLARILVEAEARGLKSAGCLIAAILNERDIRSTRKPEDSQTTRTAAPTGPSDLLQLMDQFTEAERSGFEANRLKGLGVEPGSVRTVDRSRRQLERLCGVGAVKCESSGEADTEDALLQAVLKGFPDRVARRRPTAGSPQQFGAEIVLSGGGTAWLASESVVRQAEYLVALDAEQRQPSAKDKTASRSPATLVRLASAIEPEWLLDLPADSVQEQTELVWNAESERVETSHRLLYDQLVLDESRLAAEGSEASRLLEEQVLAAGLEKFVGLEVGRYLARIAFVARTFPEATFPSLSDRDLSECLRALCVGKQSFAELREAVQGGGIITALRHKLSATQSGLLQTMAPEQASLPGKRQVRIQYERDRPPWLASRLQDFFGLREGPSVAGGRVAVTLHLLAPNQRPVQVTADLASFWSRAYPQLRRGLSRRYPRHAWPEDPLRS